MSVLADAASLGNVVMGLNDLKDTTAADIGCVTDFMMGWKDPEVTANDKANILTYMEKNPVSAKTFMHITDKEVRKAWFQNAAGGFGT